MLQYQLSSLKVQGQKVILKQLNVRICVEFRMKSLDYTGSISEKVTPPYHLTTATRIHPGVRRSADIPSLMALDQMNFESH